MFESSVKSYDTKTLRLKEKENDKFESSVKSYDTKTEVDSISASTCLRVV